MREQDPQTCKTKTLNYPLMKGFQMNPTTKKELPVYADWGCEIGAVLRINADDHTILEQDEYENGNYIAVCRCQSNQTWELGYSTSMSGEYYNAEMEFYEWAKAHTVDTEFFTFADRG